MTKMTFLWEMTEMSMSVKLSPVCTLSTVFFRLFRCQDGPGWFRIVQDGPGYSRLFHVVPECLQTSPDVPRHPQVSSRWFQVSVSDFRFLRSRTGQRDPGLFQPSRAQGKGGGDSLCCPENCDEGPRALYP